MPLRVPMRPRDADELHRPATPLELLFDLVFVVAVAQAAAGLHHGLVDGHATDAVINFVVVFFGLWWAWMNFTWFASAFDPDDAPYRVAVFVIMIGVLIMPAGIPRVFAGGDLGVVVVGYVVMRLAMVTLWLRAGWAVPLSRRCALRYAVGIFALQVCWVARLSFPDSIAWVAFGLFAVAELAVPIWAEAAGRTSWHPAHIAERYGLFTIIVLGESILAAAAGVQAALDAESTIGELIPTIVGGLLTVFCMWWLYFDMPTERMVTGAREAFAEHLSGAFTWGYGHYVIFASIAATGAGLAVDIDQATVPTALSDTAAGLALTVPVSIYLLALWALHAPSKPSSVLRNWGTPIAITLVLAASFTSQPVLATGILLAVLVALGPATSHGGAVADRDGDERRAAARGVDSP